MKDLRRNGSAVDQEHDYVIEHDVRPTPQMNESTLSYTQ